jgi:hypothetical protein
MSQLEQQQADCADDATAAAARQEARRIVARRRQLEPLYYSSYLHVNELLSLQRPKSEEAGTPAHDEMLFIITHQAYELWFRQILHELNSVRAMFSGGAVAERDMGVAVSRLERVREIQTLMLQQINVLETMSALDFLVRGGGALGVERMRCPAPAPLPLPSHPLLPPPAQTDGAVLSRLSLPRLGLSERAVQAH